MVMKCHKGKRMFAVLCLFFIMTGCKNEFSEEKNNIQQEMVGIEDAATAESADEEEAGYGANEEDADDGSVMKNYEYCILGNDSVKILKYTGNETIVFIPEKLEGKKVSVIGEAAFQNNGRIEQAVLPNGIVRIEDRAFEGCPELQYIFLSTGIREIGYRAFGDCISLEEMTFPEGMAEIGDGICEGCTALKKIVLPQSMYLINENAFMGCEELQLIYGESEFAEEYAEKKEKIYVDFKRIREEGNQVW